MKPINPLFFKIIRYYSPKTNAKQGFVLPMMIGLGLIMTLVGLTMIGRSSDDQQTVTLQNQTAQSLSITETGITRVQQLFLKVPELARKNKDEWEEYRDKIENICDSKAPINDIDIESFTSENIENGIEINDQGRFIVQSYTYDETNQVGTLEIQGEENTSGARSAISVEIPISDENNNFGLWIKQFDAGKNKNIGKTNQKINSNVLAQTCDINTEDFDTDKNFPSDTNWKARANRLKEFPELPEPPDDAIELSELPSNLPKDSNDCKDDKIFSYEVTKIDKKMMKSNKGITIGNQNNEQQNGPPCTVRIFVEGNIELRGNVGIGNSPNSLQIYGSEDTKEVRTRGNASVSAFIFAPNATAGVKGGGKKGKEEGSFNGAMWVNNWAGSSFGSSSDKIVVNPEGFNWDLLPEDLREEVPSLISIQPSSSWTRQPIPKEEE